MDTRSAPAEQPGAVALSAATCIPGPIVLFGSGEASPTARRVHAAALGGLTPPIRACVLETPAGFEPNSARVAGRLADFLRQRLSPFQPEVVVVPARRRGTPFSPDDPDVVAPLLRANYVVLGPGSPTYAANQLTGSLAWHTLLARHRLGAPLVLASAAAIAASAYALPVYEIYKVGEDLHWKPGLDLLGPYGRSVAIIPHWNNRDGGDELDTTRGFMGQARFERLLALLPPHVDMVGIDEHTALMLDFAAGTAVVFGRGGVSWLHAGSTTRLDVGASVRLASVGLTRLPEPTEGIPDDVWNAACSADSAAEQEPEQPPAAVAELVAARGAARGRGDWALADNLRADILCAGWQVQDTQSGPAPGPRVTGEVAWFAGPEHQPFELAADPARGVAADPPRGVALLLHGFPGTPSELRPLGEVLAAAGVSALAPLLPGFGPAMHQLADVGEREWLASAAEAWAGVRARNSPTLLVGYSMGGALALRLAAEWPPDRLVLVAPLWRLLGPAWPLGALLPLVQHLVPSIGLLDRGAALNNPELRQFFARAAPDLDLDRPEARAELRQHVRLPTAAIAQLWRLSIGSGTAARRVRAPTLIVQGRGDRVVRPHDTRVLGGRLGAPVQLHELAAGHLLLDPSTSAWEYVRELILSFVRS